MASQQDWCKAVLAQKAASIGFITATVSAQIAAHQPPSKALQRGNVLFQQWLQNLRDIADGRVKFTTVDDLRTFPEKVITPGDDGLMAFMDAPELNALPSEKQGEHEEGEKGKFFWAVHSLLQSISAAKRFYSRFNDQQSLTPASPVRA